jgi:hypothetical protein
MPALTVSAAARLCGVDRRTLQRAIQTGRLPLDAQHCLSREALIAAGYLNAATPQDMPQDMPQELGQATALLALLERLTSAITDLHEEVCSLRDDLRQMPQTRRRRAPTAPQTLPQRTPQTRRRSAPQRTPSIGGRGDMRRRIVALLQAHPEGLSPEDIRVYLKPEKPLGDTLQGMRKQQKVSTQGTGKALRYFAL